MVLSSEPDTFCVLPSRMRFLCLLITFLLVASLFAGQSSSLLSPLFLILFLFQLSLILYRQLMQGVSHTVNPPMSHTRMFFCKFTLNLVILSNSISSMNRVLQLSEGFYVRVLQMLWTSSRDEMLYSIQTVVDVSLLPLFLSIDLWSFSIQGSSNLCLTGSFHLSWIRSVQVSFLLLVPLFLHSLCKWVILYYGPFYYLEFKITWQLSPSHILQAVNSISKSRKIQRWNLELEMKGYKRERKHFERQAEY